MQFYRYKGDTHNEGTAGEDGIGGAGSRARSGRTIGAQLGAAMHRVAHMFGGG